MPDLETLVREVRPEPDPTWTARMDARAAAHFPSKPPRWKQALQTTRDHMLAIGAVATVSTALFAVVMVGVNYEGGGDEEPASGSTMSADVPASEELSEDSMGSSGAAPTAEEKSAPTRSGADSDFSDESAQPSTPAAAAPPTRDRAVISSAELMLSTTPDKVAGVNDRAIQVVDALGGYVETSSVSTSGRNASATLTVKIPSAKLDEGIARLSRLAHVKSRTQQAQDVTDQRSALEAAVRDARADRDGLRARLAKATTDKDRTRLRAQLDRATRRVTQRQRRVAELNHEVSYASVELAIEGDRRSGAGAPPAGRWTPGDAIGDAVRVLEVIAGVLVIALAVVLPIVVIGILAALAGRVVTRRRRERALEMA